MAEIKSKKPKEERPLTQSEKVDAVMKGLKELGAKYQSHNDHNLYIEVPPGSKLDHPIYIAKAKRTVQIFLGLVLRVNA